MHYGTGRVIARGSLSPARIALLTATAFLAMCAWVVIMASSQAHAASGLTAKASTTVPAKSYVKATVKIVLTTPKAGATRR